MTRPSGAMATFASVLTSDRPSNTKFARPAFPERVIEPKAAMGRAIFERTPAAVSSARGSTSTCSLLPWPASVLHRLFLMGLPRKQDIIARVVDQIILPAALATPRTP